ncbi:hypothetical protein [Rhizobium sp. CSW-27]|uniref:hypothetical protein n=1 Tax=Rhizobium sp. CSW-27 TaxID=2839985 RepID=UPI001C023B09|nr:hypothetical protein [Rhizobium sp. CSW-27]MBT9370319.1 hypothetical protein [Rhizobium sp. CSW-27]
MRYPSLKALRLSCTVLTLMSLGLGLSGCVNLLAKARPAVSASAKPDPATAPSAPERKTATASGAAAQTAATAYVDPMVISADGTPRRRSRAYRPPEPAETQAAIPPAETAPQATTDLAALVNQPTAVRAGSSSLYSVAEPPVAATGPTAGMAQPVLPVGRINPMAGSVFSAQAVPAAQSATGSGDGLW